MTSPVGGGGVGTSGGFVGVPWVGPRVSRVGGNGTDVFGCGDGDNCLLSGRWGCAATTAASKSRFANGSLASSGGGQCDSGVAFAGVRSLDGPGCLSSFRMALISSTARRSSGSAKREIGKNCWEEWLSRGTHATRRFSGSRRSFGAFAEVMFGGIAQSFA